ncbi:hypothetical protein I8748_31940 [Nostoc sp. CENA67]|uniref:LysM domain-containing protein n=1 Tax=Amazonocrinis nigriterrae CENA67 TaxID=2794033 RepID=A0A8J7LCE7_9NOST|nr:hypothetical protein [Amazonocrinis nigriterrae]MBH8566710.1 hypothetical protein [Amazonocrinis nigriterrae CENA67]
MQTKTGDTIASLASQIFNGDVTRFTELLDLNPDIDVFGDLVEGLDLEIPDTSQILNYAKPVLSQIGETLDTATSTLTTLQTQLPGNLQGYTADALKLLGDVNGVLGDVETTLNKTEEQISSYDGKPVQLVKWLLGGQA